MRIRTSLFLLFALLSSSLAAQMVNGTDTLYGNEWIDYDKTYFKIEVAEDGVYRIPFATLQSAGLPAGLLTADQYQLWRLGKEAPLYVSTDGILSDGDFLEFYGQKNRSELDRYLFEDPDNQMLNPYYSLITDTAAYYLTWVEPGETTLRYAEVENDLTELTAVESWCWGQEQKIFTEEAQKLYTRVTNISVYTSLFEGEGFGTSIKKNHNVTLAPGQVFAGGSSATLEVRVLSNHGKDGHNLSIQLDGTEVLNEAWNGNELRLREFNLSPDILSGGLDVKLEGLVNNQDRYSIGALVLNYPRTFDFSGASFLPFRLPAAFGDRYLEISDDATGKAYLLDLDNRGRLEAVREDGIVKVNLPAGASERSLIFFQEEGVRPVVNLQPVTFTNFSEFNADYLILTSQMLSEGAAAEQMQAYVDYRSSASGGEYQTAVVEVEDLYETFGYGIKRHFIAIKNFANYLEKAELGPNYVFIIGKGLEYGSVRTSEQLAAQQGVNFFVPSFGLPASDHLLLSEGNSPVPHFPVGRLAVTNPDKLRIYLDKIIALEAQVSSPHSETTKLWRKEVIHLGGGGTAAEREAIRNNLEDMGRRLETNLFGAHINGFYKNNTDPFEQSLNDQIFDRINEGTSLITFFGHSSPNTFDFNIDNPNNYQNAGKTPLMISLGCYSGNLFTSGESIGERFVFYENKGAIAFGASRGVGFLTSLTWFARSFYEHLGETFYGAGIGDIFRQVVADQESSLALGTRILTQQFVLHGDPAIRLNPAPGPDFKPDPTSVIFEPRVVNAQQDTFIFQLDLLNLGRNDQDSLSVTISRRLPGGQTVTHITEQKVAAPGFRKTYRFRLPSLGKMAIGENTLFVVLDAENAVAEFPAPDAEANNVLESTNGSLGAPVYVVDNTARPVYPPDFALLGEAPVTLKASTTDVSAPERIYLLEVDTTVLFNSPFKRRHSINQRGGVIRWTPDFEWRDSTVYYWRISPDSTDAELGFVWENHSFTYIEGSPFGWSQGHYWQWLEGEDRNIRILPGGAFEFRTILADFRVKNHALAANIPNGATWFTDGNGWLNMWIWEVSNYEAGVQVVVLDPADPLHFWINHPPGEYGSVNDKSFWVPQFSFPTETPEQRFSLMRFLNDTIPDGLFVGIYTGQTNPGASFSSSEWVVDSVTFGENIFSVLEAQGATKVRSLENGSKPYTFFYQKGVEPLNELVAVDATDTIDLNQAIPRFLTEGDKYSPPISGSSSWNQLVFDWSEIGPNDTTGIALLGKNSNGNWNVISEHLHEFPKLIKNADPDFYESIQLRFSAIDREERSPGQLKYWRIFHDGLPDFAINNSGLAVNYNSVDTLKQGESYRLVFQIENTSLFNAPSDSMQVLARLVDGVGVEYLDTLSVPAPKASDSLVLELDLPTRSYQGLSQVAIRINPNQSIKELHYFNNIFTRNIYIQQDEFNPLIDVTFDGVRILRGDLVRSQPEIQITMVDENEYFLLNDSTLFTIEVLYPGESSVRRLDLNATGVRFMPAEEGSEENRAQVFWTPVFERSGTYRLEVSAQDRSGNSAGRLRYITEFEVMVESRVSRFLNYPNPFTESTRFVYTLTGNDDVEDYQITIMTASGRIVRQLTGVDLGPLKVGTHQTEGAWDGRDEYGDQLANGVYFYRLELSDDYELLKNDKTEKFFKNGLGKLVILR